MIGAEGYVHISKYVLTIPLAIRYTYNVGMDNTLGDRVQTIFGIPVPKSDFQHNAALTLGVKFFY